MSENLNSNNKIHTINNFNIRTKEDYLNKMIKNVLNKGMNLNYEIELMFRSRFQTAPSALG